MHMVGTRIEREMEIYVYKLTHKIKCKSTHKMIKIENFCLSSHRVTHAHGRN
jgi:hypothetical protein